MPKRKKHMRLPNGYGSIRYLGAGRRNCYGVYPPAQDVEGKMVYPPAICYVDDWTKGFLVLTAWKAGTYEPGYELTLNFKSDADMNTAVTRVLSDYGQVTRRQIVGKTFSEVYEEFYAEREASGKVVPGTLRNYHTAYLHCEPLYGIAFEALKHDDFQNLVNSCGLRHGSQSNVVSLLKLMGKYALKRGITDRDNTAQIEVIADEDTESGVPFTDAELLTFWSHADEDPDVEMVLIMCYSGFRESAYIDMNVDLENMSFEGGVKNKYSRGRIVPIWSGIQPLVIRRIQRDGALFPGTARTIYNRFKKCVVRYGMDPDHHPHDARHTFSRLCEKYKVDHIDEKRMMGHTLGNDITFSVYGHRDLEDLRAEIEKIQMPEL